MADADRNIPEDSRALVVQRDRNRCRRCGGPGYEWHHRRSRRVRDLHRHCSCVGVLLCRTCHSWAHANPADAMEQGFIVSAYEEEPWRVPIRLANGWMVTFCDGSAMWTTVAGRLDPRLPNSVRVTTPSSDEANRSGH